MPGHRPLIEPMTTPGGTQKYRCRPCGVRTGSVSGHDWPGRLHSTGNTGGGHGLPNLTACIGRYQGKGQPGKLAEELRGACPF
jgi:hypothetical protein